MCRHTVWGRRWQKTWFHSRWMAASNKCHWKNGQYLWFPGVLAFGGLALLMVPVETGCDMGVLAVFALEVFELARRLGQLAAFWLDGFYIYLSDLQLFEKKCQRGRKEADEGTIWWRGSKHTGLLLRIVGDVQVRANRTFAWRGSRVWPVFWLRAIHSFPPSPLSST